MRPRHNPYSSTAREDEERPPYSRQALLDALDEPAAAPPPVPVRSGPARSGAARRVGTAPDPEPAPVLDGFSRRVGSSAGDSRDPADPNWQQRTGSFTEPPDDTGLEKSPLKPDPYRVTSGFDPGTGARLPIESRPRTPQTTRPLEYYTDPANARLTSDVDTTDPYTVPEPPPAEPEPTPTQAPSTPAQGPAAVARDRNLESQLLGQYAEGYARRNEGAGGAGKGALQGLSYGSVAGPIGMGVGALVGGIAGAATRNAPTAVSDFAIGDVRTILQNAYRDMFGRDIDPAELEKVMRGQGYEPGDRWGGEDGLGYILGQWHAHSAPDRAARAAGAEAPAATEGPGAGAPAGPLGAPAAAMEGFNLEREQDPSFSVKDAFAAAVRSPNIPPPPGEDKAALGDWFAEFVAPSIEAQGHTINWVEGDKVNITGPQGTGTIDWYRGAGAPGGALAWQPEGGGAEGGAEGGVSGSSGATSIQDAYAWLKANADPTWSRAEMEAAVTAAFGEVPGFEKAYAGDVVINGRKIDLITDFEGGNPSWSDNLSFVPLHGGGAGTTGGGGLTGGGSGLAGYSDLAPGVQLAAPLGRSDVLQQIMEEIRRIQSGAPPREALLEELGLN